MKKTILSLNIFKRQKNTFLALVCILCFALLLPSLFGTRVNFAQASAQSEYDSKKVELNRLAEDSKRSQLRHYWLNLAEDFYKLYQENPKWNNRPAALFRAAEAYDELAKRSYAKKDALEAIRLYELLVKNYPTSILTDDALYHSAVLYNDFLRNPTIASKNIELLLKKYSKEDHAKMAKEYALTLQNTSVASLNTLSDSNKPANVSSSSKKAKMLGVTATYSNNVVRINIKIDAKGVENGLVTWNLDYQEPNKKTDSPPRLVLQLANTQPDKEAKAGFRFNSMDILKRYAVDYSKKDSTVILFDFSVLEKYTAKYDKKSSTLIIEATGKSNALSNGISTHRKADTNNYAKESKKLQEAVPKDIALQLGLEVRTIIIDPGHGGKDPGTAHNGIIEKHLVLDLAKRLGKELSSQGYTVKYTRESDVSVSLLERAEFAKKHKGDLLISIHANAGENTKASGFETYFLDLAQSPEAVRVANLENSGNARRLGDMESILTDLLLGARMQESRRLANTVHDIAVSQIRKEGFTVNNGGTKGSPLTVLTNTAMPGILVEIGYCSNTQDAKNMKNPKYLASIAQGLTKGINKYSEKLSLAKK